MSREDNLEIVDCVEFILHSDHSYLGTHYGGLLSPWNLIALLLTHFQAFMTWIIIFVIDYTIKT